jgi:RNA polymerase sigma factor (sigma-70 family)
MVAGERSDPPTSVETFVAGDESALAEVYARWSPLVYSLAMRSLDSVSSAEAITQEVFIAAFTSRTAPDLTSTTLPAWLIGLARDRIAAAREALPAPDEAGSRPGLAPDRPEPADLLDQLVLADEISHLSAVPREVMRMALGDGDVTHAQIAEKMGLPEGLVRSHLRRSLLMLQQRVAVLHGAQ